MKIAMIGQKRLNAREGGVEVVVEELATRMVQLGHEVTCYNRKGKHTLNQDETINKLKEYKGIKMKYVPTIDKTGIAAATSSFFGTWQILFSKADVVHFHAEGSCVMIPIIKFFSNKKIIVTIHGLDWQRAKWGTGFASKYIKFGEKMASKYADEIIVLSENMQNYFEQTYHRATTYIPNGVNEPNIVRPQVIQEKYNLKKDDYFLFLGRIVPEKGIHYLIEAFQNIKTDKKLVIAGGTSKTDLYGNQLKEQAKNNQNIIFTGFAKDQELAELYSNAYVYVLPSDLEGMPLSLLEAMSYENCCLTSDIPECTCIIGEEGMTFQKSSVTDLQQKMQQLSDSPTLVKKYKKNSRDFLFNKYNWDDIVRQTLSLYRK